MTQPTNRPNIFAFLEAKGNYHKAADAVLHAADQWEQAAHNVTTKGLAHIGEYNQAINTLATTILDYRIARKELETRKPEGYR